eukprot:3371286-Prymnesium_polylepis.1
MWGDRRHTQPDELHAQLSRQLADLESLLRRLEVTEQSVSTRELMQARSRTALSCRLHARLQRQQAAGAEVTPTSTQEVFDNVELLELILSFLGSPAQLARVGA